MRASTYILTERAAERALVNHAAARTTGRRLQWCREEARLSQAELAAFIGTSKSTVARIESGARAMTAAERAAAARALGCSIATLAMPAITLGPASNGNGRRAA